MKKALFIFLLVFPAAVYAGATDIRITEIMYDPAGNDAPANGERHEWVELWNSGNDSVTIVGGFSASGWRFYDGSGSSPNHTFSTTPDSGSLTLAPGDFLIISSNTATFLADYPSFSGNLDKVSLMLGNTAETLSLHIGTTGTPWSEVSYSNTQGANGNGKTLECDAAGTCKESAAVGGSPGKFFDSGSDTQFSLPPDAQGGEEATPSPPPPQEAQPNYDLAADLRLNEFLPDPTGSDMEEWIEIWNPMPRAADLTGWKLDDGEGGSNPYEFPSGSQIQSGTYEIIKRQQTGLQLNNDLDSVRLIRPDGNIKDSVTYGDAPEGSAYAKDGIVWKWTSSPAPGAENKFPIAAPSPAQDTFLEEDSVSVETTSVKKETSTNHREAGSRSRENQGFVFEGVVTVEPGVLGTQIFYAQNKSRGLQIYMNSKDFPELLRGTRVRVTGILGIAYGEDRLKVKAKGDIQVLDQGDELEAEEMRIEELKDEDAGKLALIKGEAVDVSKGKISLAHEGEDEEIDIVWKSGAGDMPDVFPGDKVSVMGILKKNKSGFQLLPRDAGDLVVEAKKQEEAAAAPKSRRRRSWFVYAFGAASVLLSAGIIVQKRNKKISV